MSSLVVFARFLQPLSSFAMLRTARVHSDRRERDERQVTADAEKLASPPDRRSSGQSPNKMPSVRLTRVGHAVTRITLLSQDCLKLFRKFRKSQKFLTSSSYSSFVRPKTISSSKLVLLSDRCSCSPCSLRDHFQLIHLAHRTVRLKKEVL